MWNTSVADGSGYGWGGGNWFGGGGTGGAFLGGLAGGLVGDLFFDGRGRRGHDGEGEKVVQINNPPYGNGYGYNNGIANWEIMKEVSDTRYDLSSMNYQGQISALNQQIANDKSFAALQQQICCCCNETQRTELETQYKMALQSCGISREIAECCCKELLAVTTMGFETQLRDQANFGALMKELAEVKCLVKDVEKDGIIRQQAAQINQMSQHFQTKAIQDCIADAFCKESAAINQLGVNQHITNPTTTSWPPFIPSLCCC